jgi:hypothetical protein
MKVKSLFLVIMLSVFFVHDLVAGESFSVKLVNNSNHPFYFMVDEFVLMCKYMNYFRTSLSS